MKQLVLKSGEVRLEEVPVPQPKENEVLIKTFFSFISSGTESSSIKTSSQSLISRARSQPQNVKKVLKMAKERGPLTTYRLVKGVLDFGVPVGYSLAGEIISVGEKVKEFSPGEIVACAGAGHANHAEFVAVNKNLTVKIPAGVPVKEASLTTIGSIALQGVRQADPKIGELVGVIGLGLIGQLTLQILRANGARVAGFDPDERRREIAKSLGADYVFSNPSEGVSRIASQGLDSTIITASTESSEPINQAMEITRKRGKVVIVGAIGLNLNRSPWYEKEIELLISTSYGPGRYDSDYEEKGVDYPTAYVRWTEKRNMEAFLDLLAQKKLDVLKLIEKEFPLAESTVAYKSLGTSPRPLGVVLKYASSTGKPEDKIELRHRSVEGKINVGLIGAGSFAQSIHLPNLAKLKDLYSLKAICATDGLEAKRIGVQYGAEYATSDYRRILDDKEINLVIITTRHNLHAPMVIEALRANKNILVEKPLCLTAEELKKVTETYETLKEPKPILMVGFNRRFSPCARGIKEAIAEKKNPIIVSARVNAGYLPPDHWTQGSEGGGRIIGEACHFFDLFNFFTGSDFQSIEAEALSPNNYYLSGDNLIAVIKYKDGSMANLVYTALGSKDLPKEHVEVFADGKAYIIEDFKALRVFGRKGGLKLSFADKGHLEELKSLARGLKDGRPPIPFEELIGATKLSLVADGLIRGKSN